MVVVMGEQELEPTQSNSVPAGCAAFDEIIFESGDELVFMLMEPEARPQTSPASDQNAQHRG
jgi:hypothetical protein